MTSDILQNVIVAESFDRSVPKPNEFVQIPEATAQELEV